MKRAIAISASLGILSGLATLMLLFFGFNWWALGVLVLAGIGLGLLTAEIEQSS